MITENLSTLKIHKLTKEQYDREFEAGRIDENALYLTPDEEMDLSGYATVEQLNTKVDSKIAEMVNSAPETLDTLNELADALGRDPNFATTVATQIGGKVDKIDGKGLSTNDLTDELLEKLEKPEIIESGEGFNSIQQPKDSENWSTANVHTQRYIAEGITTTDENSTIITDENGKVLVGAYGKNSTMMNGKAQTVSGRTHAEGSRTIAFEANSHAEGHDTLAGGRHAHAEGSMTAALGIGSHSEGMETLAFGLGSHSEGYKTEAGGEYSHAEGANTCASGDYSHAEGEGTVAYHMRSHAEGNLSRAEGINSHAEGEGTVAKGYSSHAEGDSSLAEGDISHAEGHSSQALGDISHAEGQETIAKGYASHAEGEITEAEGIASHAEGQYSKAIGNLSHTEGYGTIAEGLQSHAGGNQSKALGENSFAHGKECIAGSKGYYWKGINFDTKTFYLSTTQPEIPIAISDESLYDETFIIDYSINDIISIENGSHFDSFGKITAINGNKLTVDLLPFSEIHQKPNNDDIDDFSIYCPVKPENGTVLLKNHSVAFGYGSKASGNSSLAIGIYCHANGNYSHAEGHSTEANASYSHAEGQETIANGKHQHVQGKYNKADTTSAFIIGNGSSSARSNAMEVDWNGNVKIAGELQDMKGNSLIGNSSPIVWVTIDLPKYNTSSSWWTQSTYTREDGSIGIYYYTNEINSRITLQERVEWCAPITYFYLANYDDNWELSGKRLLKDFDLEIRSIDDFSYLPGGGVTISLGGQFPYDSDSIEIIRNYDLKAKLGFFKA